jgi:hypothetical protein
LRFTNRRHNAIGRDCDILCVNDTAGAAAAVGAGVAGAGTGDDDDAVVVVAPIEAERPSIDGTRIAIGDVNDDDTAVAR